MKFLFTSFSSTGHVSSVGPIVAELRARNHDVVWLTGERARQTVEGFGARFVRSEHALDWHARPLTVDPNTSGVRAAVSLCRGIYVDSFNGLVQDLKGILAWFSADVIVTDLGGHGAAAINEMGGPVYCTVFHVPACHWDHNPDDVVDAPVNDDVTPFTYWIGTRQHWSLLKPLLDTEREKFALPPLPPSFVFKDLAISPFLNLAMTTSLVEYPEQLNQPQSWKVGPVFSQQGDHDISGWLCRAQESSYVIHVTQGTFNPETTDTKNLIEPTFEAFKDRKDFLIIATGAGMRQRFLSGEFPSNVYCEDFIPHAHLLPHVHVVITNAGFGGVLAALNNGVPLVCAGRGQDKADVSDLVEWQKFGINLETNFPTSAQIFEAVETVRRDQIFSTRVKEVQNDFACHDAPKTASDLLEKLATTKQPVLKPDSDLGMFHWNLNEKPALKRRVVDAICDHFSVTPDDTAVQAHDGSMTYSELEEATWTLSRILSLKGIRPGDMVPICFSRGKSAIVAMIGVLRARAAFVPLDPANPTSRLEEILANVRPAVVLASVDQQKKLAKISEQVLVVGDGALTFVERTSSSDSSFSPSQSESGWDEVTRVSTPISSEFDTVKTGMHPPPVAEDQGTSDVAYIIFTSGSTGKPKGVVIDNQAICTSIAAQNALFGIDRNTRMLQSTSISFDASLIEVLGTLMGGGCVFIPSDDEKFNDISGYMRRLQINTAFMTPSLARLVEPHSLPDLKTLILGGEALQKENVLTWGGRVNLFNAYGPTEASIVTTVQKLDSADSPNDLIGKPLACSVWVVDEDDYESPLPQGKIGELLIEGPILALGYLNDEEKTRDSFVSPLWLRRFRKRNSVRAYRTGDLVRFDPEGRLRYVARKDLQVKLRGLRVEIGEVEYHVSAVLPGDVKSAAVVPKSGALSGQLVAVVMPPSSWENFNNESIAEDDVVQEDASSVQETQELLRERLPSYMIPSTFVRIKSAPTQTSGKLDRKWITALVEKITSQSAVAERDIGADRSDVTDAELAMETALREILPDVSDSIDLDRTFRQLGGDSVIGMGLAARLRSYGYKIRYSDLMGTNSLAEIASECLKSGDSTGGSNTRSRLQETDEANEPIPASRSDTLRDSPDVETNRKSLESTPVSGVAPIQQMYFDYLQWPKRFHSSQTLRIEDHTCSEVSHSIAVLVQNHDMLRARFEGSDTSWEQRIEQSSDGSYSISVHDDLSAEGMAAAISRAHESIDIVHGPVFTAVVFLNKLERVEYLHLIAHHLVMDLVSWHIVMNELDASLGGKRIAKQNYSTPFLIWQQRQEEYGISLPPGGLLPAQIPSAPTTYWGDAYSPGSVLNANSDRCSVQDLASERFELPADTTYHLFQKCAESTSLQVIDVLLACFLYSFYSSFPDRKDICVWNQLHGRDGVWEGDHDIDIEGTVGWFNIFVPIFLGDMRSKERAVHALTTFVESVKQYRDSISGRGLPYFSSRFYNAEGRKETQSHMPMELVFNYTGRSAEASGNAYRSFAPKTLDLPGWEAQDVDPTFKLTHILDVAIERGGEDGSLDCRLSFDRLIGHQDRLGACWRGFEAALTSWSTSD